MSHGCPDCGDRMCPGHGSGGCDPKPAPKVGGAHDDLVDAAESISFALQRALYLKKGTVTITMSKRQAEAIVNGVAKARGAA